MPSITAANEHKIRIKSLSHHHSQKIKIFLMSNQVIQR